MERLLILGAAGNIASHVIDLLRHKENIEVTLFLRNKKRLRLNAADRFQIIEGDVLDYSTLRDAVKGKTIVYVNLAGDLETMANNIVRAMKETGVHRIIAISSIGIYATPVNSMLIPYRKLADIIESSGLGFTILRPTWFTNADEIDYEITKKGEPERGSRISKKSIAHFVMNIIAHPEQYTCMNIGINKPGS